MKKNVIFYKERKLNIFERMKRSHFSRADNQILDSWETKNGVKKLSELTLNQLCAVKSFILKSISVISSDFEGLYFNSEWLRRVENLLNKHNN